MALSYKQAQELLEQQGQAHVLRSFDELSDDQKSELLRQIEELDFDSIAHMQKLLEEKDQEAAAPEAIEPAEVISLSGDERVKAAASGDAAIAAGKVGVILVAGGQGSRLGFDGPKGSFPVGPISGATLFEIHAHKILALEKKHDAEIPFYIMTSETNDAATRAFFKENDFFGLSPDRVYFFVQGMWPALWEDGKLVMDRPDHIFGSPDGHGGTLRALKVNGMLDNMKARGVEILFYFQVDNPLVEVADPAFIGLHRDRDAQVSVKVCAKRDPDEGLGVVVQRGDRNAVVEYTELTEEQKHERRKDGELRFKFGSVAIHVFDRTFLEEESVRTLPIHLAHKKVPYCAEDGQTVKPDEPNAYKFEKFIFDSIPDAERSINLEFDRAEEFSPVKNAEGNDSPATARRDMIAKWARWFDVCGVAVPRDEDGQPAVKIEIDPCVALGPDDMKAHIGEDFEIDGDVLLD